MTVQQRRDHPTQPPRGELGRMQNLTTTSACLWQQQKWRQEQEREWEGHLRSLQQCVCELLIKNQKLRDSLMSAEGRQREWKPDAYDQNAARNCFRPPSSKV
jgi:hypothetical protein